MARELTQVDTQSAEAIQLYGTLLKAYPNYPRNDQVLYQLARAYDTTGQSRPGAGDVRSDRRALSATRAISARCSSGAASCCFPSSAMPMRSTPTRRCIARGPSGSGFYPQSLYKHAWSQFKQGMNEDSLQGLCRSARLHADRSAAAARAQPGDALGRADRELVDDTLRVMSISFSYLDGAQSIDELIAHRHRMPYAWLLYERLGDLYVQKQRYQDAATTYRAFVARDPVDEHAPALTMAAIEAYRKGGFPQLMLQGQARVRAALRLRRSRSGRAARTATIRRWSRS